MRILWVKVGGLWPLNTGGRLRSFHTIAQLARRHRVTVLTTHGPADAPEGLDAQLADCEQVLSVPYAVPGHDSARFALALVRSWLSPLPVDIWRCRVPALRREVARHLARGHTDLCVVDFLAAAPNVAMDGPVPSVLFAHNVEHMIWKRLSQIETRAWRRALLEVEWQKLRRYEARACARARLTVAVSEVDREILATHAPRARVEAIPTGVDTAYFAPDRSDEIPGSLVFFGSMDWLPNEDGIEYFVESILPRIRAEAPEVSLTVVGRNPSPRVRRLAAVAGVRVTGTVEDVRPHVAAAAVCVVPLRIGGRVDDRGSGRSSVDSREAFLAGGRSGAVRGRRRRAPAGSSAAESAGERRAPAGRGTIFLVAGGSRVRGDLRRRGGRPCVLACSASDTSAA
ncbi:MAG: glycosyltransferase [Chloroflexi bacterium]|nr:MAG: glycosyltransferase [Chloroflexota bacterium]